MADYPKLILDLEYSLAKERDISRLRGETIESLERALELTQTLSEQRNRTIGELGASLAAVTAERNGLRLLAQQAAMECPECDYGSGSTGKDAEGSPCKLCSDWRAALASPTQGETK